MNQKLGVVYNLDAFYFIRRPTKIITQITTITALYKDILSSKCFELGIKILALFPLGSYFRFVSFLLSPCLHSFQEEFTQLQKGRNNLRIVFLENNKKKEEKTK